MKNRLLVFLLFVSFVIIGCAQKESKEEMNEISPAQEQKMNATIVKEDAQAPSKPFQEENTTSEEASAEKKQPEEKVELTFEQAVWNKRIDAAMAPSYCPPVTKVTYPSSYYQGPLIDTHYHLPSLPVSLPGQEEGEAEMYKQYYGRDYVYEDDEEEEEDDEEEVEEPYLGKDIKMSEIACTLQHEGTTRNFALFPIYSEISPHALEMAKRAKEQYPELFTPFMDSPTPEDYPAVKSEVLSEILAVYPGLFQGWGEIHLGITDDSTDFPPDSQFFTKIYPIIRKHQMMVWMHPREDMEDNFERVLKQNPDINFIVHGDQIKDDIEYLMSKHPNIYFCINNFYANQNIFFSYEDGTAQTKESFFAALENYESLIQKDLRTWKNLIETHPDQVIWCLDRDEEVLWTFDRDVGLKLVDYARAFIGRLDPAVQEKFAYRNAERLIQRE